LSYISGSEFSIKLNGVDGDGFITPTRGLMQGCPLSPYLFIISMEALSQMLQAAQNAGAIREISLTPTAPTLTHSMYADDLVLFSLALNVEVRELSRIMGVFGDISGLRISNAKSVVWFSHCTNGRKRRKVLEFFPAKEPNDTTTYLGFPMPKGKVLVRHYNKLEDKVDGRCSG
jgi:Reverse transcriptase (RNA-dependent DNA polymerase)